MIKSIDMKRLLLLAIVLFGVVNAWAEEGSKEFKKNFPAASINELTVTNRYGNIDVKQEGDEFSITTSVWVEAKTKAKVDEILEYIFITAKEQGAVLNVETLFQKDMSLRQMFAGVTVSVDYHIKVPKGKKVRLVCTEGGASVADFVGDMSVEIVSGNFKANSVTGGEFSVKQNKGEFEVEKLGNMTEGGPYYATDVIATYVYRTAFSSEIGMPRLGYASAAALFFGGAVIIIGILLNAMKDRLQKNVQ